MTKPDDFVNRLREVHRRVSRPDLLSFLRIGLLVVGLAQIAVTLPTLFSGGGDYAWDLLSLQVAVAVGFLVCAVRPHRAPALVLMVGTGAVLMIATAVIELARSRTELLDEVPHVVTLVGWLLICLTTRQIPSNSGDDRLRPSIRLGQITSFWHRSVPTQKDETTERGVESAQHRKAG